MAKQAKKTSGADLNHPQYESLTTVEEIDGLLEEHKNILVGKDKTEMQIKQAKKDFNAAHNELLKELLEEREHEVAVLDALLETKQRLLASAGILSIAPKTN